MEARTLYEACDLGVIRWVGDQRILEGGLSLTDRRKTAGVTGGFGIAGLGGRTGRFLRRTSPHQKNYGKNKINAPQYSLLLSVE